LNWRIHTCQAVALSLGLSHQPFVLWLFFETGSHFTAGPACSMILLFMLPCVAGIEDAHQHAHLIVQMGSPKHFA
jgi:fumarate reductase subunit D